MYVNICLKKNSDKEKFQIDYSDEAIRGVLAVDAGTVTWPAPQKPPPPPPAKKDEAEVRDSTENLDLLLSLTTYISYRYVG